MLELEAVDPVGLVLVKAVSRHIFQEALSLDLLGFRSIGFKGLRVLQPKPETPKP